MSIGSNSGETPYETLGRDPAKLDRISDAYNYQKFSLPTLASDDPTARSLARIYALEETKRDTGGTIRRLSGGEAANAVLGKHLSLGIGRDARKSHKAQFANAMALTTKTEVFELCLSAVGSRKSLRPGARELAHHMTDINRELREISGPVRPLSLRLVFILERSPAGSLHGAGLRLASSALSL